MVSLAFLKWNYFYFLCLKLQFEIKRPLKYSWELRRALSVFHAFFDSTMPNTTKTNFFALYWWKKIDNVMNYIFTKGNLLSTAELCPVYYKITCILPWKIVFFASQWTKYAPHHISARLHSNFHIKRICLWKLAFISWDGPQKIQIYIYIFLKTCFFLSIELKVQRSSVEGAT